MGCSGLLNQGQTARALDCFEKVHRRTRDPYGAGAPSDGGDLGEAQNATDVLTLRHDAEMWRHLEEAGLVPPAFAGVGEYYSRLSAAADQIYAAAPLQPFTGAWVQDELWRRTHRRAVVVGPGGSGERNSRGLLRADLLEGARSRGRDLEREYARNTNASLTACGEQDGWVVVDDLLRPAALPEQPGAVIFNARICCGNWKKGNPKFLK